VPDLKITKNINPHILLAHSAEIIVIPIFLKQYYIYEFLDSKFQSMELKDLQGKSSCSNFCQKAFKNNTFQCFHVKQQNQMSTFYIIQ